VQQGKHRIEVIPKQLKRRKLLKRMIKICAKKEPIDFILYIGDDTSNEKVFNYMNTLQRQNARDSLLFADDLVLYPCTIGRRVTQANFFLSSQDAVLKLI